MMENHSFDNIAGYWDFHPDIDNLRVRLLEEAFFQLLLIML